MNYFGIKTAIFAERRLVFRYAFYKPTIVNKLDSEPSSTHNEMFPPAKLKCLKRPSKVELKRNSETNRPAKQLYIQYPPWCLHFNSKLSLNHFYESQIIAKPFPWYKWQLVNKVWDKIYRTQNHKLEPCIWFWSRQNAPYSHRYIVAVDNIQSIVVYTGKHSLRLEDSSVSKLSGFPLKHMVQTSKWTFKSKGNVFLLEKINKAAKGEMKDGQAIITRPAFLCVVHEKKKWLQFKGMSATPREHLSGGEMMKRSDVRTTQS